jgi:hypothetical protein
VPYVGDSLALLSFPPGEVFRNKRNDGSKMFEAFEYVVAELSGCICMKVRCYLLSNVYTLTFRERGDVKACDSL